MQDFLPLPGRTHRAVLTRNGGFRLVEEDLPHLSPGDLLFRLIAAGLTPEDVAPRLYINRTPPGIPVGEVAAAGEEVTGWHALDRALLLRPPVEPGVPDLSGLARYVRVSADLLRRNLCLKLPQEIPAEDATLVPAAALGLRLLREAAVPSGGRLLVLGLDLIGQIVALLARHQRVDQIFAADLSPTLRRKAEWSGATRVIRLPEESVANTVSRETGGAGVHAVVVLVPDASMMHEAFGTLVPRGGLVLGARFPASVLLAFSTTRLQARELRIQGVRTFDVPDLRDALNAVRQGIVNAETLVSKRVSWEDLESTELGPDYWSHGTHVVVETPLD